MKCVPHEQDKLPNANSVRRSGYVLTAYFVLFTISRLMMPRMVFRIGKQRFLALDNLISIALFIMIWRVRGRLPSSVLVVLLGFLNGE